MSNQAGTTSAFTPAPAGTDSDDTIAVTCLHGDESTREAIAARLASHDRFAVEQATDSADLLDRLDDVDGVVSDCDLGLELIDRIRDRGARVPVVIHTDAPRQPLVDTVLEAGFVDLVRSEGENMAVDLLARRLSTLVDYQRTAALARRARAATEATTDGLAVIEDGTVAFANDQLARKLGHDRVDLVCRPWRDLFDDVSVGRLEADALSAVDDGWQWVGTCEWRRADGEAVPLRTLVTDSTDGSIVFAVLGTDPERGD